MENTLINTLIISSFLACVSLGVNFLLIHNGLIEAEKTLDFIGNAEISMQNIFEKLVNFL